MTTVNSLPEQDQRIVLDPVYSNDFINVYDVGSALDSVSVIADVERFDWIDSTIVAVRLQMLRELFGDVSPSKQLPLVCRE